MIFHEIFKKEEYLGNALKYVIDNNEANLLPYHYLNHNIVVEKKKIIMDELDYLIEIYV